MNGLKFKRFFDEENNLCPYSIDLITQSGWDKAFLDISTFKKCTESLIELLRDIDVNQYGTYENLSFTSGYCFYYEVNSIKNMNSMLKSDKHKIFFIMSLFCVFFF